MTSTLQTQLVHLGDVSYPYSYGTDCVPEILDSLKGLDADRFIVVTDTTVLNLHAERLLPGLSFLAPVTLLSMIPGDGTTSIANLSQYLETAVLEGASSRSVVVAFGGGAPGHVTGLMAALLFGGVRLVHVATTMIAAMDSVISLKQAVHSSRGENHFGTYLTPSAVYLDMVSVHQRSCGQRPRSRPGPPLDPELINGLGSSRGFGVVAVGGSPAVDG